MPQDIATIKLVGFKQLFEELEEFPRRAQKKALRQCCMAGADIIRDDAKKNCYRAPRDYWSKIQEIIGYQVKIGKRLGFVDVKFSHMIPDIQSVGKAVTGQGELTKQKFSPGWVAKNIFIGRARKRPVLTEIYRVFLGDAAWFGRFLEYGTSTTPKHPFIRPALWKNVNKILNVMRRTLADWLVTEYRKSGSNRILQAYIGGRGL